MRRVLYIILLVAFLNPVVSLARGKDLLAYLSSSTFTTAKGYSYYETYFTIIGQSAVFTKDSNGKYQSKINIRISFLRGDSVVTGNNYNLKSEEITDTLNKPDFMDVQRYWLKPGDYTMKIVMKDMYNPTGRRIPVVQKIHVGYNMDSVRISDVEFLQSYTASDKPGILSKSGYQMIPYVYNYYPEEMDQIKFYAEIYNSYKLGDHSKFLIKYEIESAETNVNLTEYRGMSVQQTDTVNALLGGFSIKELPSGSYNLKIEVIDKNNAVKTIRIFNFLRHNPVAKVTMQNLASVNINSTFVNKITNKDTLIDFIKSLSPISNMQERDFENSKEIRGIDTTLLKQYFYNFWQSRNAIDPEDAWKKYNAQVQLVNSSYGSHYMRGYQTDRGRVYLQYGTPNNIAKYDMNPATYPYEIWEYYKLPDGQTERKFVFYNPDLVSNNYILLNSNARGEIQDRRWQVELYKATKTSPGDLDKNTQPDDPFGENALDQYNNPR